MLTACGYTRGVWILHYKLDRHVCHVLLTASLSESASHEQVFSARTRLPAIRVLARNPAIFVASPTSGTGDPVPLLVISAVRVSALHWRVSRGTSGASMAGEDFLVLTCTVVRQQRVCGPLSQSNVHFPRTLRRTHLHRL